MLIQGEWATFQAEFHLEPHYFFIYFAEPDSLEAIGMKQIC